MVDKRGKKRPGKQAGRRAKVRKPPKVKVDLRKVLTEGQLRRRRKELEMVRKLFECALKSCLGIQTLSVKWR